MRISDWSSDVCSSDLVYETQVKGRGSGTPQSRPMLKGGFRACGRGIKGETRNRPKAPGSVNDPGAFVSPSFFPARRRPIPLKSAQTQISQYRSSAFGEIGRESCRDRVCQSLSLSVVAVA